MCNGMHAESMTGGGDIAIAHGAAPRAGWTSAYRIDTWIGMVPSLICDCFSTVPNPSQVGHRFQYQCRKNLEKRTCAYLHPQRLSRQIHLHILRCVLSDALRTASAGHRCPRAPLTAPPRVSLVVAPGISPGVCPVG